MLLEKIRGARAATGAEERVSLEKGIAEARATLENAGGSDHEPLRATLAAFIAQCEKRIADIKAIKGR